MKSAFYLRCLLFSAIAAVAAACASESELTAIRLDTTHPLYKSEACQRSLASVEGHKNAKQISTFATPVLVVLSGGLLLPLVAANAGLDTVDRVDASNMSERCGGKGKSGLDIAKNVVQGAALGAVGVIPPK